MELLSTGQNTSIAMENETQLTYVEHIPEKVDFVGMKIS